MTEMYTIMRYIEPQVLADAGIHTFDNWASTFAKIEQCNELKPECDGKFQIKTRVSNYACFDQLRTMFAEVADIKTADMLHLERLDYKLETIKAPASRAVRREMQKISRRADRIRQGSVDPSEDNMLKLTTDGKKVGLDIRMINPYAKDEPNSKINLCINKVMEIYKETTSQNGVQMIFCDMGTPKKEPPNSYAIYKADETGEYEFAYRNAMAKGDNFESIRKKFSNGRSMPNDYDRESFGKIKPGDLIVIRTLDDNGNAINTAKMVIDDEKLIDADRNTLDNAGIRTFINAEELSKRFCVYDDIKAKLMAQGVPEKEIAFIHDYEKAADKQLLYNQMNEGKVRVMIGSTQKCGAGMNAQKKMVALHHLDVPARPSDVEQRNGRILRRGNENKHVRIFRYVTDRTFDAYSFQILENKQKFISQAMTGQIKVKRIEDVQNAELSYAEAKALCAGNPLIKKEMELQALIKDLKMEKSRYSEHIYELQDNIRVKIPEKLRTNELVIEHLQKDMDTANKAPKFVDENGKETHPVTIMETVYNDRKEAGTKLKSLISANAARIAEGKMFDVGEYRGFKLSVFFDVLSKHVKACLDGEKHHYCDLNPETDTGNLIRLDNCINNIQKSIEDLKSSNETMRSELKQMEADVDKPFSKAEELLKAETEIEEVHLQLTKFEMTDDTLQKEVFEHLADMFPQVLEGDSEYMKFSVNGGEDLHVEMNGDVLTICQTYEQNGDLMYDPRIDLKVDYDNQKVIPLNYENSGMGVYEEFGSELTPETAKQMNDVLDFMDSTMLENIEAMGYEPMEIEADRDRNVRENDMSR